MRLLRVGSLRLPAVLSCIVGLALLVSACGEGTTAPQSAPSQGSQAETATAKAAPTAHRTRSEAPHGRSRGARNHPRGSGGEEGSRPAEKNAGAPRHRDSGPHLPARVKEPIHLTPGHVNRAPLKQGFDADARGLRHANKPAPKRGAPSSG
jgi:hypothetical protein